MSKKLDKVFGLIESFKDKAAAPSAKMVIGNIQVYQHGYAEPGYGKGRAEIVALGDWNTITKWNAPEHKFDTVDTTPTELSAALSDIDVTIEWEDEWATCDVCGKLVRTQPNSYCWQKYWADMDDIGRVCGRCLDRDKGLVGTYLRELEGHSNTCVTIAIPLEKFGYLKVNEEPLEFGLNGGQCASPKMIAHNFQHIFTNIHRFIFKTDYVAQFGQAFSVFVHRDEFFVPMRSSGRRRFSPSRYNTFRTWFNGNPRLFNGPDPKDAMVRGLADATAKIAQLPKDGGILMAKIREDGTADVRSVSTDEFVKGIGKA